MTQLHTTPLYLTPPRHLKRPFTSPGSASPGSASPGSTATPPTSPTCAVESPYLPPCPPPPEPATYDISPPIRTDPLPCPPTLLRTEAPPPPNQVYANSSLHELSLRQEETWSLAADSAAWVLASDSASLADDVLARWPYCSSAAAFTSEMEQYVVKTGCEMLWGEERRGGGGGCCTVM